MRGGRETSLNKCTVQWSEGGASALSPFPPPLVLALVLSTKRGACAQSTTFSWNRHAGRIKETHLETTTEANKVNASVCLTFDCVGV